MRRLELDLKPAVWFFLTLMVGACFGGGFVQGLPCEADLDCEPSLSCHEGYCGGLGDLGLCGNGLREVEEECDDGNRDDGDGCSANCLLPAVCGNGVVQEGEVCDDGNAIQADECTANCTLSPETPRLELRFAQVKQFQFSWQPVLGAEYYQLFERTNAGVEFAQVGGNVEDVSSYSLAVSLRLRVNASYKLRACNTLRCVDSDVVDVAGSMAEAIGYFKASNTDSFDTFGTSIALSGDGNTLAVGAPGESSSAAGIGGDQGDNVHTDSGAVYVFVRIGEVWSQQAYVKASNSGSRDRFGSSLALSEDGNTLAIGAPEEQSGATGIDGDQGDSAIDAGAVYVFVRTGENWSQQTYVKASNTDSYDKFGSSVALSEDGNTLAVGAPAEKSGAAGIDGDQGDVEGPGAGAVYVLARTDKIWSQQAYVKASNPGTVYEFGRSVALSQKGTTLAVGATGEKSNATGIDGEQGNGDVTNAGAVYVFERIGSTWSQQAYVKASNTGENDLFGESVALSGDGDTLAVGAPLEGSSATGIDGDQGDNSALGAGAVYVFSRTGKTWSQQAYVKASNTGAGDRFGTTVALSEDGTSLAVGASEERSNARGIDGDQDNDSTRRAGAVYVFVRADESWSQQTYVKASHTIGGDYFGGSVGLSKDATTLAVGAAGDNYGTTGIGSKPSIAAFDAGAVYLY